MRTDVQLDEAALAAELAACHARLHAPGDRLFGLPSWPLRDGLRLRCREADGEYYLYVEDPGRHCLAGLVVLNRLIEVGRRWDPLVRAPHTKIGRDYRRRGLARALYAGVLEAGLCLLSGARQSPGAQALWDALARDFDAGYVTLEHKALQPLGPRVSAQQADRLQTRRLLLGRGWDLARLAAPAPGAPRRPAFSLRQWLGSAAPGP